MGELLKLPNIGKVLESNLLAIGVHTPRQLKQMGSREAFMRIRLEVDSGACLHMLYGLQGAVEGIPDKLLSEDVKAELKSFYHSIGGGI